MPSISPVPDSTAAASADGAAVVEDWRAAVLQSYRNTEVREIAKVLAALEPGASTASKLMLATRFEDSIFKSATSLADYRKRLTKRLKRLQKNYKPPGEGDPSIEATNQEETASQLLLELRVSYGDALRYIYANAATAIQEIQLRLGSDRASQLQQHTDSARQWALDLGVVDPSIENGGPGTGGSKATQKKVPLEKLKKLQQHLDRRVDNIRSYVVKHADPDLFLQETLERKDKDLPARASHLLAVNVTKRMEQLQQGSSAMSSSSSPPPAFDAQSLVQAALERAQAFVPPPTRNSANDVPAALLHLEKLRNASTAIVAYLATADRSIAPRGTLVKAHTVAIQGMEFVKEVALKQQKLKEQQLLEQTPASSSSIASERPETKHEILVTLEDAWSKVLELPNQDASVEMGASGGSAPTPPELGGAYGLLPPAAPTSSSNNKRQKHNHLPPVYKSRVLLTPNRKTPSNLLPALKRKRATLVRPPHGMGSHLVMDFGTAFRLTIYLCPLVVTIRALSEDDLNYNYTNAENKATPNNSTNSFQILSSLSSTGATAGCATWTPLYHGLTTTDKSKKERILNVWGVSGPYGSLGHVVEERLRDASTHATYLLRKCFQNSVKDKTRDFEVEILEATALLEFLQLARRTYIPNWQDADVD
jgi:KIX domain